jgi:Tol biopolymer transport system component
MKKVASLCLLLIITITTSFSQAKTRRLPSSINHPSLNLYAPYISHDGNALLFISDSGEDGALTLNYTSRENDWAPPTVIPKTINHRITFLRGYGLSADGKRMYYSSAKSPTIGGYDIFTSELKGTVWTDPQNILLPLNSKLNEACASFTTDGSTIYFMRCGKMDQNSASDCKIFRSKKKPTGQWEEPEELPASINTGNSQTPRIMADGETLIFSSNKMASTKGGMDLYQTKFINDAWTTPVALDYINTDKDDQYISVSALGRYVLRDTPSAKKINELVEFLIPNELRPRGMMKIEGRITDTNNAPAAAYLSVIDLSNNKRFYSGRPAADGSYLLYLMEGTKYEMSVDPEQSNMTYYSKQFDLRTDKIPQREKVNVTLKTPVPGDELPLDLVKFEPNSSKLDASSDTELKRLVRLVKANPALRFEIQVLLNGYEEDSVQVSPDLTEMVVDSILSQFDDIDTLGQLYKRDTIMVKTRYHNDRTFKQAQAIITYLSSQGIETSRLTYFGNAIEAILPENKKLTIKAVAR